MRLTNAAAVFGLLAPLFFHGATAKPYPQGLQQPAKKIQQVEVREMFSATPIDKRQDCAVWCGQSYDVCCPSGSTCGTEWVNGVELATCNGGGGGGGSPQQDGGNGEWTFWTSTWVETGVETKTAVFSSFIAGTTPPPGSGACTGSSSQCGSTCCEGGYYCHNVDRGVCSPLGGGTSPGLIGTPSPSAPLRPTASTLIVITATGEPTATQPFEPAIPTGADGTLIPVEENGGGLSGGAIAGIVIGVIAGVILLLLLCLYCCAKSVFDGFVALLGMGKKKRKHTHEETYIEHSHHHSGHGSAYGAGAGGRRWYGQPSRPARPAKKKTGLGGALGVGAGLAGLAIALGLKRRHDRKYDDKSTTISGSSYYTDYTSTSSASSDDRRTRHTRHSSRR